MEVIRGTYNLRARHQGCVATVGNFDGVHRGHQAMLARLREHARSLGVPATVVTFEPQPREFFRGQEVPARLTRLREKLLLLAQQGVDRVLLVPFDAHTAGLDARDVVRLWFVEGLGVRRLMIGDDFRFGRGRSGDVALLRSIGEAAGFDVDALDTERLGDERISSTAVRAALAAGDLTLAETLLGRDYFMMGRVVYGRQLGRTLDAPTLNVPLGRYRSALNGVFSVTVDGLGERQRGVANIGVRPTVDGTAPLLEVHLLDWAGDAYGALVTVRFHRYLRAEQRFDSLDALRTQIGRDIADARASFVHGAAQTPPRTFKGEQ